VTQATKVEGEATVVNLENHVHLDRAMLQGLGDKEGAPGIVGLSGQSTGNGLAPWQWGVVMVVGAVASHLVAAVTSLTQIQAFTAYAIAMVVVFCGTKKPD
jgi:hypothetical protein